MKHNTLTKIITLALAAVLALSLAACGSKADDNSGDAAATTIKSGVPNDTTNEARALLLLQENGIIKLKDGVGITATKNDIVENPYNVEIVEAEAAQLPNMLPDLDYAVINSNYAISAGLNPVSDSLLIEGSASAYANILTVKEGNEPRFWRSSRPSWPTRASPWTSRSTMTTLCPTPWWTTAPWTPTTSSTCPIWRTSMPRTALTSSLFPPSTWSPWACTAASRPLWTL